MKLKGMIVFVVGIFGIWTVTQMDGLQTVGAVLSGMIAGFGVVLFARGD